MPEREGRVWGGDHKGTPVLIVGSDDEHLELIYLEIPAKAGLSQELDLKQGEIKEIKVN